MNRINQRTNNLIGRNLVRLREQNHLRNRDVVMKLQLAGLNVNSAILTKVEKGINNPSVDMLIELTKIYKCDFNAFFEQSEE